MDDLEMTYYLDLTDRGTRERILAAENRHPEDVDVLVRLAANRRAPPINAKGRSSEDKQDFVITVGTAFGAVTHSRGWSEIKEDIASHDRFY